MKDKTGFFLSFSLTYVMVLSAILVPFIVTAVHTRSEALLFNVRPTTVKQYSVPLHSRYDIGYSNPDFPFKQKNLYVKSVPIPDDIPDDVFRIEASDAIDGIRYSQRDVAYSPTNFNSGVVPSSSSYAKHKLSQTSAQNPRPSNLQEQTSSSFHALEKDYSKPLRDTRLLDTSIDNEAHLYPERAEYEDNLKNNMENILQTHSYEGDTTNIYMQTKNNFTDASDSLVPVSSDAVLSYEIPSTEFNDSILTNSSAKQSIDIINDVPSHNYSDFNISSTLLPVSKTNMSDYITQNSVELNTHIYIDLINETTDENVTNSLPSIDFERKLSSGTVAGIVIAVLVSVTLLSSAVIYLLYRKFNGKCTSVVESKFNTDNCGYLDDSLRSSIYLNNHIELPKESSEEMTSLDNDSFLNSLETMTIQNYWADNSKNTKV